MQFVHDEACKSAQQMKENAMVNRKRHVLSIMTTILWHEVQRHDMSSNHQVT